MLARCLIYVIFLPVFENIYILVIVLLWLFMYLCIYFYIFLNSFLVFILEDDIGNKRAIVCLNVSILGKYYIYMYYNVLPNKLTHSHEGLLVCLEYVKGLCHRLHYISILSQEECLSWLQAET